MENDTTSGSEHTHRRVIFTSDEGQDPFLRKFKQYRHKQSMARAEISQEKFPAEASSASDYNGQDDINPRLSSGRAIGSEMKEKAHKSPERVKLPPVKSGESQLSAHRQNGSSLNIKNEKPDTRTRMQKLLAKRRGEKEQPVGTYVPPGLSVNVAQILADRLAALDGAVANGFREELKIARQERMPKFLDRHPKVKNRWKIANDILTLQELHLLLRTSRERREREKADRQLLSEDGPRTTVQINSPDSGVGVSLTGESPQAMPRDLRSKDSKGVPVSRSATSTSDPEASPNRVFDSKPSSLSTLSTRSYGSGQKVTKADCVIVLTEAIVHENNMHKGGQDETFENASSSEDHHTSVTRENISTSERSENPKTNNNDLEGRQDPVIRKKLSILEEQETSRSNNAITAEHTDEQWKVRKNIFTSRNASREKKSIEISQKNTKSKHKAVATLSTTISGNHGDTTSKHSSERADSLLAPAKEHSVSFREADTGCRSTCTTAVRSQRLVDRVSRLGHQALRGRSAPLWSLRKDNPISAFIEERLRDMQRIYASRWILRVLRAHDEKRAKAVNSRLEHVGENSIKLR